jgi:hypothetical protein
MWEKCRTGLEVSTRTKWREQKKVNLNIKPSRSPHQFPRLAYQRRD